LDSGLFRESGAEIAFPGAATDCDDELAFVFRASGDLQRGPNIRAGGDAGKNAVFEGQTAGHLDGVIVGHGDNFINDFKVDRKLFLRDLITSLTPVIVPPVPAA
jgi:hypothetical protein